MSLHSTSCPCFERAGSRNNRPAPRQAPAAPGRRCHLRPPQRRRPPSSGNKRTSRLPSWSRPGRGATGGVPRAPQQNQKKGLNENYGRELLELHTLGVDGGYTQKDVTEVARSFTGWTITNPRLGGGFRFDPRLHDAGQKVVLGHVIKAGGGESDGEQVPDI